MFIDRKILSVLVLIGLYFFWLPGAAAQNFAKWEKEISTLEARNKADKSAKKNIVFTGSSSIRLWENLTEYFPGKKILNHGFGGSQTDEVAYFADRLVTPYKPKQVVVYSGDNDLASGKTPEKVLADFKVLYDKIKAASPKATVTFIAIKPSPSRKHLMPQITQANTLVKNFLEEQKRTSYVDIYTPMLLPSGKPKPELFKADSLHMTKAGYDIWAQALKPYLK